LFIPLLTLGVPWNDSIAMIFVALMIYGIRLGPLLLQEYPDLFRGVIASIYIGNAMLPGLNLLLIRFRVRLLKVPYRYLAVIVVIVCIIWAYSVKNSPFDVGMILAFGLIGYLLRKFVFPASPFILAMILGPGRKVILLAILRRIFLHRLWRRCFLFFRTYLLPPPFPFAEGKQGEVMKSNIPPMLALHQHGTGLAAQSAFPSGPLPSFQKKSEQLIWR
jgi:hypothetical protein